MSGPVRLAAVLEDELNAIRPATPAPAAVTTKPLYAHAHTLKLSALCLSGGGIRSASFCLGVIQGLADKDLLQHFDYLSTVSGGGYIGSFLSAWLARRGTSDAVIKALKSQRDNIDAEAPEIRHLRQYSSYLTPRYGALTADTWTALAIVLRNALLNWLILLPVIAFPVIVIKALTGAVAASQQAQLAAYIAVAVLLLATILGFGIKLRRLYLVRRENRSVSEQRQFLWWCVFPAVLTAASATALWYSPAGNLEDWLAGPNAWWWLLAFGAASYVILYLPLALGYCDRWKAATGTTSSAVIKDTAAWIIAGASFGILLWLGFHLHFGLEHHAQAFRAHLAAVCVKQAKVCSIAPVPRFNADLAVDLRSVLVILGPPWVLLAIGLSHAVYLMLRSWSGTGDFEREWLGRASGWHLIVALAWTVLSALVLLGPMLYFDARILSAHAGKWLSALTAASGAVTAFLGKSTLTPAKGAGTDWKGTAANIGLAIAGPLFVALLLVLLSIVFDQIVLDDPKNGFDVPMAAAEWCRTGIIVAVLLFVLLVASFWVNVNRFSLHAVYRNRLVRAYLGASNPRRKPDGFTGFDFSNADRRTGATDRRAWARLHRPDRRSANPDRRKGTDRRTGRLRDGRAPGSPDRRRSPGDNLRVAELFYGAKGWRPPQPDTNWRPFHVINMTLNLAAPDDLAWQQRKAMSFVVTPRYCGAAALRDDPQAGEGAFRKTEEYGDPAGGISLGTAMAISGAAVSSNMGYHSSPTVELLLTFFNVRLGWWLGNPGKRGDELKKPSQIIKQVFDGDLLLRRAPTKPYQEDAPWFALRPLLSELFGWTNECSPYVYLSDGGHFENLGLYEMVRRRCKWILVVDADCDPNRGFADLGNAVRKVWIDLGIRIRFDPPLLQADNDTKPTSVPYFALGTVEYVSDDPVNGKVPTGEILYVKPTVRGDEGAADIVAYRRAYGGFPHQTTGNQWFDESQLEAYRRLGHLIMTRIVDAAGRSGSVSNLPALFGLLSTIAPTIVGPSI